MTISVLDTGAGVSENTQLVVDAIRRDTPVEVVVVDSIKVRRRLRRQIEEVERQFAHTPQPLIESWRVAQKVIGATQPGDVIIVGDRDGTGGVLALIESSAPIEQRRQVWTVAGDGTALETMLATGTIDHVEMPVASSIDWELTQYAYSSVVLATAPAAVDTLDRLGVGAHLVDISEADRETAPQGPPAHVFAPGPVSRGNRTGEVLRAVASIPDVRIDVSSIDTEDLIWSGTTWDTFGGVRTVLGDRLTRSDDTARHADTVVLGDPVKVPDATVRSMHANGARVLASEGSVAAALWPGIATWGTSDELAALLAGGSSSGRVPPTFWTGSIEAPGADNGRARRVSVGVPVFRNVEFLDACIVSIVNQTDRPHEIVIIDDGSGSDEVSRALSSWTDREPGLVRVITQPNRGVCVARNTIIEAMTGDAFVLVDQDDVLEPEFTLRTAQALRQDPSMWAVASWTRFFGEYQGIEAKPPFDRRVGLRENPIVSTAALVDMRVREDGVLFAPDLAFIFCEDWHYWSQIVALGGRVGLVPEALVNHRVHLASGGFQRTELAHRVGSARAIEPLLRR